MFLMVCNGNKVAIVKFFCIKSSTIAAASPWAVVVYLIGQIINIICPTHVGLLTTTIIIVCVRLGFASYTTYTTTFRLSQIYWFNFVDLSKWL